ncbi:uncharacterized protein LOC141903439 [Tubulanus polymorphus]|uniref:uncharacterized protein LOC141903439 n=1 Tax=Tubulanus polymorphus TaxID=672921 RepID=UPI003DA58728
MSGRITVLSQRSINYFKSTGLQSSVNRYTLDTLSYAVEARDEGLASQICRHKLPQICIYPGDDTWQQSPLYEAVNTGQDKIVEIVLRNVDLKGLEKLMGKCLVTAIGQRNRHIVELLVKNGCDVNYEYDGESPLARACMGGYIDMAEFIKDNGGLIFGDDVLKSAAGRGYEKAVEKIIEWSEPSRHEVLAAIREACKKGQCRVIETLVDYCKPFPDVSETLQCALEAVQTEKYEAVKLILNTSLDRVPEHDKRDEIFRELLRLVASDDRLVPEVLLHFAVIIENEDAIAFCLEHDLEIVELVYDQTALHTAVTCKQDKIIALLLESIDDVECPDKKGRTPLILACEVGCSKESVQLLLDHGARINAVDKDLKTALISASAAGHMDLVDLLIESRADIDARDSKSMTAAHHAAGRNRAYVIHELVEAGADLTRFSDKNNLPLHEACRAGGDEIVEMILDQLKSGKTEFDLDVGNVDGSTALYLASDAGDLESVKMLISAGVDVLVLDKSGRTALHAGSWKEDLVTILIDAGIDVNSVDCDGETALYKACQCDPEKPNVIREFIPGGADVNMKTNNGETALIAACKNISVDTVGLLLEAEVDVNYHADAVDCALMELCKYSARGLSLQSCQRPHLRQTRIAQWLIEHGVDVVTWGEAALEEACFTANNISLLKALLERLPQIVVEKWLETDPVFRLLERNLSHNFRHKRYAVVYTVNAVTLLATSGAKFDLNNDRIVDLYEWNLFVSVVIYSLATKNTNRNIENGKIPAELFKSLISNSDIFTIELLLESGFEIPNSDDAYGRWRGSHLTTECPSYDVSFLDDTSVHQSRNARTLKSICRVYIRRFLGIQQTGNTLIAKIFELPLPNQLTDYLTFVKLPR